MLYCVYAVTGLNYTMSQLSWNSSQIGAFHPLIQQKRLQTGKAKDSVAQGVLAYRGLPFVTKPYGLVNMTGVNEGVAFGPAFEGSESPIAFDSAIVRPTQLQYTGEEEKTCTRTCMMCIRTTNLGRFERSCTSYGNSPKKYQIPTHYCRVQPENQGCGHAGLQPHHPHSRGLQLDRVRRMGRGHRL
jgi:hypothetical protein